MQTGTTDNVNHCRSGTCILKAVSVVDGTLVPVLVIMNWVYSSAVATVLSVLVVILLSWDSVFQYVK